jgi:hypothetical protein
MQTVSHFHREFFSSLADYTDYFRNDATQSYEFYFHNNTNPNQYYKSIHLLKNVSSNNYKISFTSNCINNISIFFTSQHIPSYDESTHVIGSILGGSDDETESENTLHVVTPTFNNPELYFTTNDITNPMPQTYSYYFENYKGDLFMNVGTRNLTNISANLDPAQEYKHKVIIDGEIVSGVSDISAETKK